MHGNSYTSGEPHKASEYCQEIPQSQTADEHKAPQGRNTEHGQQQHNLSIATSSLFLNKMIAKLEGALKHTTKQGPNTLKHTHNRRNYN